MVARLLESNWKVIERSNSSVKRVGLHDAERRKEEMTCMTRSGYVRFARQKEFSSQLHFVQHLDGD
jgi:hypothetical protein